MKLLFFEIVAVVVEATVDSSIYSFFSTETYAILDFSFFAKDSRKVIWTKGFCFMDD